MVWHAQSISPALSLQFPISGGCVSLHCRTRPHCKYYTTSRPCKATKTFLLSIQLYGDTYYVPFYLETVKAFNPVMTGVGLLPITVGIIPTTLVVGLITSRCGRFRWAVWSGWVVTILGTGLLIALEVDIKTWQWILCLLVLGFGHGMILTTMTYVIQVISSDDDGPYALAMYTSIRTFGMCVGVAIGGTVFQNLLSKFLGQNGLDRTIAKNAEQYVKVILALPSTSPERELIVSLYAKAFRGVFEVLTGISVGGGLAGLFIKSYSMDRKLKTKHGLTIGRKGNDAYENLA